MACIARAALRHTIRTSLRNIIALRILPPVSIPDFFASGGAHLSTSAPAYAAKKKPAAAPAEAPEADDSNLEAAATMDPKDLKTQLAKHVEYAKRELSKLRGAVASPNMLDHVRVEAYGESQPLNAVAQIVAKTPQLILVHPFDSALASSISNAIRDADLNLNPSVDGTMVRVPVPKASKETKEATVKLISKIAETAKTRVRRSRQAAMDKLKKADGISSDFVFKELKEMQNITNDATDEITKLADKKKLEVEAS